MIFSLSNVDFSHFEFSLELGADQFPFFVEINAGRVVCFVEVDEEGLSGLEES